MAKSGFTAPSTAFTTPGSSAGRDDAVLPAAAGIAEGEGVGNTVVVRVERGELLGFGQGVRTGGRRT